MAGVICGLQTDRQTDRYTDRERDTDKHTHITIKMGNSKIHFEVMINFKKDFLILFSKLSKVVIASLKHKACFSPFPSALPPT